MTSLIHNGDLESTSKRPFNHKELEDAYNMQQFWEQVTEWFRVRTTLPNLDEVTVTWTSDHTAM